MTDSEKCLKLPSLTLNKENEQFEKSNTIDDYNPTLYYSKGKVFVSWVRSNDNSTLIEFSERSVKKVMELAYNYCAENNLLK